MTSPFTKRIFLTTETNRSGNLNGIDLIKFFCALLVFIIHVPPFRGNISGVGQTINFYLQHYLGRIAVPFYFVCSGFFLFRKMPAYTLDADLIQNYCFKLLRLLGTWYILLFVGKTGHIWYLVASVVAVLLICVCRHLRLKPLFVFALAGLLYTIGLLGDSYHGFIAPLKEIPIVNSIWKSYTYAFDTTRNGVFMGFIFVLIGATLSQQKTLLKPFPAAIGFVVSMLLLLAEVRWLRSHRIPIEYNMYIALLPAVFFLFSFARTISLKEHTIYKHLRNIGMLVYLSHRLIDHFVARGIYWFHQLWNLSLQKYQFAFTLVTTLIIATFVEQLACRKCKWLRWLFS